MMQYKSSIIIPVYNQWNLTRKCLYSLAKTINGQNIEIIVVDNASSDQTPKAVPFVGEKLFGKNFTYIRNEVNRNFAGATNQGAKIAKGEYLIFLNNDTEVLPNWYEPLLSDFQQFTKIAATGPILLYPPSEPFGYTIQHLGVYVGPFRLIDHLYEGISAASHLAQKRRFFQIITAACMMIPRHIFMSIGLFEEKFVNGLEDIDLCLRLNEKNYSFTVNPNAKVIHYQSQTPGRHDKEKENSAYLNNKSLYLASPDYHLHVKSDGMIFKLTPWLSWIPEPQSEYLKSMDPVATSLSYEQIKEAL
ncbi:MAG: glycosyltransferase family 2 protein, partial [Desulfovibrio sp.]|nr:glycosyltransferase family 2 protein [Desulfovibrio sp.]